MKSLKSEYIRITESYISTGDVRRFLEEQQATIINKKEYIDDISEYDYDFFDEVFDKLWHTDFESPSDEYLHEPSYLLDWVSTNYPQYINKMWQKLIWEGPKMVEIPIKDLYVKYPFPFFRLFLGIFLLVLLWALLHILFISNESLLVILF